MRLIGTLKCTLFDIYNDQRELRNLTHSSDFYEKVLNLITKKLKLLYLPFLEILTVRKLDFFAEFFIKLKLELQTLFNKLQNKGGGKSI